MSRGQHRIRFASGRSAQVPEGASLLEAAELAGEPIAAECAGRGACGRCLVQVLEGEVEEARIFERRAGRPCVLACLTPVTGPLTLEPLHAAELPRLLARDHDLGLAPLDAWAPRALALDPIVPRRGGHELGVAIDLGTTTLRLLLLDLASGIVLGEASAYNPQIARGADVISRIVAAERGHAGELAGSVRAALRELALEAARQAAADPDAIRAYLVAGNLTMIHLLLGEDPSGIRRVPSEPRALAFPPRLSSELGWPARPAAPVHTVPAAGGWVGGDIVAGMLRAGFPASAELTLYVDLGTNGELALGLADFAVTCACSAGPAFEGAGIRCGMRADPGAIDGARIDATGRFGLSVIGGGDPAGLCGSGLIALADALFAAGWIDRSARFTAALPDSRRLTDAAGAALSLSPDGGVALWERDLQSLLRTKAAVFAGIRSLLESLGESPEVRRILVSGNFGRYLNLPAAIRIGLLPSAPIERFGHIGNGSLEGAALALLSRAFHGELEGYLRRVTYLNLSEVPGYMDELVGASFLPHTTPARLRI